MNADLMNYPYFWGPQASKKAPSLHQIVSAAIINNVQILGIGANHNLTSGIDTRFHDYMKSYQDNPATLERDFEVTYYGEQDGSLSVHPREAESNKEHDLTVLHTQVVRTRDHRNMPADIIFIGTNEIIEPGRDTAATIANVRNQGDVIVLGYHIGSKCGLLRDTAVGMVRDGQLDGIAIGAVDPKKANKILKQRLVKEGIPEIPVTGGHSYKFAGRSNIELEYPYLSAKILRGNITSANFKPNHGKIGLLERARTRDLNVLFGATYQIPAGGIVRDEYLRAVGGLRKGKW